MEPVTIIVGGGLLGALALRAMERPAPSTMTAPSGAPKAGCSSAEMKAATDAAAAGTMQGGTQGAAAGPYGAAAGGVLGGLMGSSNLMSGACGAKLNDKVNKFLKESERKAKELADKATLGPQRRDASDAVRDAGKKVQDTADKAKKAAKKADPRNW